MRAFVNAMPFLFLKNRLSTITTFILCALLCIDFAGKAQINPTLPNWVQNVSIEKVPKINANLATDGYYYLLIDLQSHLPKQVDYAHYALSAFNETALTSVSQIEINFDPQYQKAELHFVRVHRGGVVLDRTKTTQLNVLNEESQRSEGILNGRKTLYANLSDIRKNDVIEYAYSIKGRNPILKNYFDADLSTSYAVPVGKVFYRITMNPSEEPQIVYKNQTLEPIIEINAYKSYTWEITTPPIIKSEENIPLWFSPFGSIQITNLKSWLEVKAHCKTLFTLKPYNTKGIERIVDSIRKTSTKLEDQVTAAITFCQSQIRYSGNEGGIYSHVPRSPDIVLKNHFGDCKEKSVLLKELLMRLGVNAYPVLINTYLDKKVQEHVPAINIFNHAIVMFQYNGSKFFIDPTIPYQSGPFHLRSCPRYETGMVLDSTTETFTDIPFDTQSKTYMHETFTINENGDAHLVVKTEFSGLNADEQRYYFLTNSIQDVQENYRKYYVRLNADVTVVDTLYYKQDDSTNTFSTYESYLLKGFWTSDTSNKTGSITKDFLPYGLQERINFAKDLKRNQPLKLYYPLNYKQVISIILTKGWNIKDERKEKRSQFFTYRFQTSLDGNALNLDYSYESKRTHVMPEEYKMYKDDIDFLDKNMIFSSYRQDSSNLKLSFNWPLLLSLLLGILAVSFLIYQLNQRTYKSIYKKEYDTIGGWLILPALGLGVSPLLMFFNLINLYKDQFSINYYDFFLDPNSVAFSPIRGYYAIIFPFFNVALFGFITYLLVLFVKQKPSLRPYYCIYQIIHLLILVIDLVFTYSFYGTSDAFEDRKHLSSQTTAFIRALVGILIWVPYIWYSNRSRETFADTPELPVTLPVLNPLENSELSPQEEVVTEKKDDE